MSGLLFVAILGVVFLVTLAVMDGVGWAVGVSLLILLGGLAVARSTDLE